MSMLHITTYILIGPFIRVTWAHITTLATLFWEVSESALNEPFSWHVQDFVRRPPYCGTLSAIDASSRYGIVEECL